MKIFVSATEFCHSNMHVAKSQIRLNLCDLLRRQNSVVETKIFAKILQYTRSDLLPQHVAATSRPICTQGEICRRDFS